MNPDKAQALLQKIKSETLIWQERREIAEGVAKSLEARNKSVLDNIEREGTAKKRFLLEDAQSHVDELNEQITGLKPVRTALLDEIGKANELKTQLDGDVDILIEQKDRLNVQIDEAIAKLTTLDEQLIDMRGEIKDYRGQIQVMRDDLGLLARERDKALEDRQVLNDELGAIETDIIAADADFKAHKANLEKQISQTNGKLQTSLNNLTELYNKDAEIRKSWADGQARLDKREETVRKLEIKLQGSEKRIAELDQFMRL